MWFLDFLFPKLCVGCGKFGTYFCSKCVGNITQSKLVCPNCERTSIGGMTHPLCRKKYGLDGHWSLGVYQDALKKAVQKLKYNFVSDLALTLVDLMIEYWAKFTPQFMEEVRKDKGVGWMVVPVPLYSKRQKWRGFNQSALIGSLVSNKLGLGYSEALKRVRYTKPQVELSGRERRQNIKDAFSLDSKLLPLTTNVLLIDDVWTTGSTLKECCWTLKKGGAKKVWALTLAR